MHPMDTLASEHRLIDQTLAAMQAWATVVRQRALDDRRELGRFVAFFHGFVENCHRAKEEDILFRALLELGVAAHGPVGDMLQDHEHARRMLEPLEDLAILRRPWTDVDRLAVGELVQTFGDLLRAHMQREERVLFPLLRWLAPAAVDALAHAFERFASEPGCACEMERARAIGESLAAAHAPRLEVVHRRTMPGMPLASTG